MHVHIFPLPGLYGKQPKYTLGAVRNAETVHKYFPGWTTRFYVRRDVHPDIVQKLRELGAGPCYCV